MAPYILITETFTYRKYKNKFNNKKNILKTSHKSLEEPPAERTPAAIALTQAEGPLRAGFSLLGHPARGMTTYVPRKPFLHSADYMA